MVPEKTEALLVTDWRSFQYPKIVLGDHVIEWKRSIGYLGVQLDRRLRFGEHLSIATVKVIQFGTALTRLVPNIFCFVQVPLTTMLSRRSCARHSEVWCLELSQHTELCQRVLCWSCRVFRQ